MKIHDVLRDIAQGLGCSFMYESRLSANNLLDAFRRDPQSHEMVLPDGMTFPVMLYVQAVDGSLSVNAHGAVIDSPECDVCFMLPMPFQARGPETVKIAEELNRLAVAFVHAVNSCPWLQPIAGPLRYSLAYDDYDANLCVLTLTLTLTEAVGSCPPGCSTF